MAPAVVSIGGEAIDVSKPPPKNVKLFDAPSNNKDLAYGATTVGPYKEVDRNIKAYKKDVEESGEGKWPPASYPHYLPTWELTGPADNGGIYPPLQPFEHYEHGKDADATFPNLLPKGVAKLEKLTPLFGSEVRGVQLSQLTDAGKDELALYVAQRGVVVFRDQDFADLPIKDALEFGGYFGRHHIHPASGQPKGHPEIHLVHRGAGDNSYDSIFTNRVSSVAVHSDVTYEVQPPGTTFLYVLDLPIDEDGIYSGGDTVFVNQREAYNRLSPSFKKLLHGLRATHSGVEQANGSLRRGGIVRREPVISSHPIVRTHPATGEKALFVNPQFTRSIEGFKAEESEALLKFLYEHINTGLDFQLRAKWEPKTVVVWDNRVTAHSAILDWDNGARRHLARITPQAEKPYETPYDETKEKKANEVWRK